MPFDACDVLWIVFHIRSALVIKAPTSPFLFLPCHPPCHHAEAAEAAEGADVTTQTSGTFLEGQKDQPDMHAELLPCETRTSAVRPWARRSSRRQRSRASKTSQLGADTDILGGEGVLLVVFVLQRQPLP